MCATQPFLGIIVKYVGKYVNYGTSSVPLGDVEDPQGFEYVKIDYVETPSKYTYYESLIIGDD